MEILYNDDNDVVNDNDIDNDIDNGNDDSSTEIAIGFCSGTYFCEGYAAQNGKNISQRIHSHHIEGCGEISRCIHQNRITRGQ